MNNRNEYGLSPVKTSRAIAAPEVDYRPPQPNHRRRAIALIGAGGISPSHLQAYQACGLNVVAIVDRTLPKAQAMRDQFYRQADVSTDYRRILQRQDVEVVDVTTHPADRLPILEAALTAGKHVLSQKPLVLDLDDGERLVSLADRHRVKFAVNQNGRWAPHFSYMLQAVESGLIGEVVSIDFSLQWDQTWISGIEALESLKHLILFDFGIHWFDITQCLMRGRIPTRVWAQATGLIDQRFRPPALAAAVIEYPGAQVRMAFNGHAIYGEQDLTTIVGTKGTLRSRGPGLNDQPQMEVYLDSGTCQVPLEGSWFNEGFQGTMCELMCAIEQDRRPSNSAEENLHSLALCFAALQSAETGQAVCVGSIRRINPDGTSRVA